MKNLSRSSIFFYQGSMQFFVGKWQLSFVEQIKIKTTIAENYKNQMIYEMSDICLPYTLKLWSMNTLKRMFIRNWSIGFFCLLLLLFLLSLSFSIFLLSSSLISFHLHIGIYMYFVFIADVDTTFEYAIYVIIESLDHQNVQEESKIWHWLKWI